MQHRIDEPGTMRLTPPPIFSFEHTLGYMARSANECLYRIENGTIIRCVPVGPHKPVVAVGTDPDGSLSIRISGVEPADLDRVSVPILEYVTDWLDLRTDLAPFFKIADRDPLLCGPAESFRGLRLVGVPDLYEAIGWAILGQQINLPFAYTLKRRLVESFGGSAVDGEGVRHWIFPAAETIAALNPADLIPLKMTAKKAEYLIHTAQLVASGTLTKEKLSAAGSASDAERLLTSVRGIGPWTAHYVAMRCLRFPEAFPIQDVGLHLAIKKLQGADRKPTLPEIREMASRWTGWEAYATFYLWRTLY
ncbi:DNA-3-methyladenine glycosylase family protein [Cohnella candidum]|nr:DNA-3-methyladenine glycosylase [Cohnella candidum]